MRVRFVVVCVVAVSLCAVFVGCDSAKSAAEKGSAKSGDAQQSNTDSAQSAIPAPSVKVGGNIANLVPSGYQVFQELKGDLNKDGLDDYVVMIQGKQNAGRIGIIIAFNNGGNYEVVLENRNSFSYDGDNFETEISNGVLNIKMEDGTSIDIEAAIKNGVLNIKRDVAHCGAYCGSGEDYSYKFRYQNSDFEMIGYDSDLWGRECAACDVGSSNTSINLLGKKMQTKETVTSANDGKTKSFNEKWDEITIKEPLKLRNIDNFNKFNIMNYISKK
jgi:hypothetical protein